MSTPTDHPVVIFDGHCNFCSGAVRFIAKRDRAARFRFAPAQSAAGQRLLDEFGLDPGGPGSIVLITEGQALLRSEATLTIASRLDGPVRHAHHFRAIPLWLRDEVYELVARIRHHLAGRTDECMVPSPELRSRFLD